MNSRFCHARISMNGASAISTPIPTVADRNPAGVKTPTGPFTDILHAWHGNLAYDPALVQAPIAIVRGEWDGLLMMRMRDGCSTLLQLRRSNATSRSAGARI